MIWNVRQGALFSFLLESIVYFVFLSLNFDYHSTPSAFFQASVEHVSSLDILMPQPCLSSRVEWLQLWNHSSRPELTDFMKIMCSFVLSMIRVNGSLSYLTNSIQDMSMKPGFYAQANSSDFCLWLLLILDSLVFQTTEMTYFFADFNYVLD